MHPKERKILQRKFARGPGINPEQLEQLASKAEAEPSTELRDATCPSLFFIMKENFIYMRLTFHLGACSPTPDFSWVQINHT